MQVLATILFFVVFLEAFLALTLYLIRSCYLFFKKDKNKENTV